MTTSKAQPEKRRWRRRAGPAVILFAAFVAITPQLVRHNSCGHDFDFHLVSWLDTQASWSHGIVYPHWSPSANYGAGEPRFVFYPPVTWMLGAALGLVMSWKAVPIVITFLFLAGTGLATRMLARQALDDVAATLAGCAALFSGYALFTAYERAAFGELSGGFWIPLLLLFLLRNRNAGAPVWRRAFDGSTVPLSLVLAGAWLSNLPLGVMASYLLAGVALVWAALTRSWSALVRATAAGALGIGLAAFYLVPAAVEQRWVEIRQATDDPGSQIENSWMFGKHANQDLELHDIELAKVSFIALTMIAVALGGVLVAWRRGRLHAKNKWWVPLALIPLAVLMLQLPASLPVWNALPKLRFLQFPWRWLVVVEAPMGIFFASAVWMTNRWMQRVVVWCCSVFFLAVTVATSFVLFQRCEYEDSVEGTLEAYRNRLGFEGTDEYAPRGADNYLVATGLPDACLTSTPSLQLGHAEEGTTPQYRVGSCDATYFWTLTEVGSNPEHLRLSGTTPRAGYMVLKQRAYPAWRVKVNGRVTEPSPQRDDGLMVLPVPEGPVQIMVDWTTTEDVIAGRWLSAFVLVLVVCTWWMERRLVNHKSEAKQECAVGPRV